MTTTNKIDDKFKDSYFQQMDDKYIIDEEAKTKRTNIIIHQIH